MAASARSKAIVDLVDAARHLVALTSQDPLLRAATQVLEVRALDHLAQTLAAYGEAVKPKRPRANVEPRPSARRSQP